jgi:hypothetical protein
MSWRRQFTDSVTSSASAMAALLESASQTQDPGGKFERPRASPPLVSPGGAELLVFPLGALQGITGTILQEAEELLEITEHVENFVSAGKPRAGRAPGQRADPSQYRRRTHWD